MKKYIIILSTIILTVIYISSYIEVRLSHLLIHTSSFSANSKGIKLTYSHEVRSTDIIGLLQPRLFYTIVFGQFVYKPLMFSEKMYWHVVEPRNSIRQYEVEDSHQPS